MNAHVELHRQTRHRRPVGCGALAKHRRIAATLPWAAKTEGFDFSGEDRVDAAKYNLIQWQSLMGENVPYLMVRDARDLRKNRKALLEKWRESRIASITRNHAAEQTDADGKYDRPRASYSTRLCKIK